MQPNFGADPFALAVRLVWRVVAPASATELGAKVGGLNLIEVMKFAPSLVAHRAGNVDFKF